MYRLGTGNESTLCVFVSVVFPKSSSVMIRKMSGAQEMAAVRVKKRAKQLPFSIAIPGITHCY